MAADHSIAQDPLALFRVDPDSRVAPYRQLHTTVVDAVRAGRLVPGQRLPTVRALAAHLAIAANTVAAAYRSLEEAGVVEGRGRAGTFVKLGDDPLDARAREVTRDAVVSLRDLGVAKDRALRLVSDAFDAQ